MKTHLLKKSLLIFLLSLPIFVNAQYKLDLKQGLIDGTVNIVSSTPSDIGDVSNLYDNDINSVCRSANVNPYEIVFNFPSTVSFEQVKFYGGGILNTVTLETANTLADLNAKSGTYAKIINAEATTLDTWYSKSFASKVTKYIKVSIQRTQGDNYVHAYELQFYSQAAKLRLCDDGTIIANSEEKLNGYAVDAYGNALVASLTYSSSNSSIVSVTGSTARGTASTGNANITATLGALSVTKQYINSAASNVSAPVKVVKIGLFIEDYFDATQNKRWHEIFGWNDPASLAKQIVDSLEKASNYTVDYQIVKTVQCTQTYVKIEGVVETLSSLYQRHVQAKAAGNYSYYDGKSVATDYNTFIATNQICEETNAGLYNEVWIYSHPLGGIAEANQAGPAQKVFFTNGTPVANTSCNKVVNIMGLNYERSYELAMHSYGHRVEGTMKRLFGAWNPHTAIPQNDFEKFTLLDMDSPGNGEVGNIHFPFNGTADYDYGNYTVKSCNHSHWSNFPAILPDNKVSTNCQLWGCNEEGYMKYWFSHLPRYTGVKNGVLNDWWYYIVDFYGAEAYAKSLSTCTESTSGNLPPAVSITSPANAATFTAPATVSITASASDADGSVAKVEFYNGATLLGTDLTSPYAYSWAGVAVGTYAITAKAYDNVNAITTSSIVNITVSAASGCTGVPTYCAYPCIYNIGDYVQYNGIKYQSQANGLYNVTPGTAENWWKTIGTCGASNVNPTVNLTAPTVLTYTAPATVSIAANAADADGSISKVEFYQGTTLLNSDISSPYAYNWTGVVAGTYSITAKAYDNSTGVTTSSAISITVNPAGNVNPTVSLTAPTVLTYTAPATVSIAANAADADGTISKVEFYQGTTLLNSDITSPYAYSLTGVAAGTYSITAKAYDNSTGVTTSSAISITVNPASNVNPTVSLTSPTVLTYTAPATVSIVANAADTDGSISKVEFYNGATLLNSDATSPYVYTWTGVAAGTYSITAKAYDNSTGVTTSSAISITVNPTGNVNPTVSLTSPTVLTYTAPATVSIAANAADADGTISKVEFYNGATLLNSDATSPYAYTWTGVAAGTYTITAKAYDNVNATTTSSAVTVTVTAGGTCTAPIWNSSTAYSGGAFVQFGGIKYLANWWTSGEQPDLNNGPTGTGKPWTSQGTCTSRIGELVAVSTTIIYPNPSFGTFTIAVDENVYASVLNTFGTEVASFSLVKGTNEITLSLASGIYFVNINNQVTKLVIE